MSIHTNKNKKLIITHSKIAAGLGVFAAEKISEDDRIEKCPLVLVPIKDMEHINSTLLRLYYYDYSKKSCAIVLGYGSLYNHSYSPNARYVFDYKNKSIVFYALKDITEGEEIFVNYNFIPEDKTPLNTWYDPDFKEGKTE